MATQDDIEYHYDVDNHFYELFLDKDYLAYSCAVWKDAQTLESAQKAKLDRLSRYAEIKPHQRVIDVGCGWGGLLKHISQHYADTHLHGLTLSTNQSSYVNALNLPQTAIQLMSWQDFKAPEQKFDAIVSIGAFEHFASFEDQSKNKQREIYQHFFEWCRSISTNDASIGLQTIVINRAPKNLSEVRDSRFILTKVFPGSALPCINDIQASIVDQYEIAQAKKIGLDYARTLNEWNVRLKNNKEKIISKYSEALFAHYQEYFEACERCFESGYVDLFQVSLKIVQPTRILAKK